MSFDYAQIMGWEDEPEQTNIYREAGLRYIAELDRVLSFVAVAKNKSVAVASLAFAFGRHHVNGCESQTEIAQRLGVGKANISREVKKIQRSFGATISGIEPMPGQRTAEACKTFRDTRNQNLK